MFRECIAFVQYGLEANGYEVTYAENALVADAINIVFAAHCNAGNWRELSAQAARIIVYNWEPASPLIGRFNQTYIRLLRHVHVWDYSRKNIQQLREVAGVDDVHHLPMAYAPSMGMSADEVVQDIDVLFYGTMYARRRQVVDAMRAMGLHVVTSDDIGTVMGQARDDLIRRAKVVLNIHAFDFVHVFEIARVSYWLANKKAVVTEVSSETEIDDDLRAVMAHGSIDELAQLCFDLVHDEPRRLALAQRCFEVFERRNAPALMKTAVERYLAQTQIGNAPDSVVPLPKIAHIGSGSTSRLAGMQWCYSHCNIDARSDFSPDWVLDVGRPLPFGELMPSQRFGATILQPMCFDKIIAVDFFQRVPDLQQALTNCLTLLDDGGLLEFSVPLDLSYDALAHVEDKRLFNEHTFGKILDNWWQYGWLTHRLEIISVSFGMQSSNAYGFDFMAKNNNDWSQAMRVPRVVDIQQLMLRKRELTADERKQLPQTRFMD